METKLELLTHKNNTMVLTFSISVGFIFYMFCLGFISGIVNSGETKLSIGAKFVMYILAIPIFFFMMGVGLYIFLAEKLGTEEEED